MSSFSSAPGDGAGEQSSRKPSLSASSQASSSDLRRTSRLSSTAGIFDLDDDNIDAASGSGRRASNTRVSSLGSSSHHGSLAERGSRDLFDVQEEDSSANPATSSSPPAPTSASNISSKAAGRSSGLSVDSFAVFSFVSFLTSPITIVLARCDCLDTSPLIGCSVRIRIHWRCPRKPCYAVVWLCHNVGCTELLFGNARCCHFTDFGFAFRHGSRTLATLHAITVMLMVCRCRITTYHPPPHRLFHFAAHASPRVDDDDDEQRTCLDPDLVILSILLWLSPSDQRNVPARRALSLSLSASVCIDSDDTHISASPTSDHRYNNNALTATRRLLCFALLRSARPYNHARLPFTNIFRPTDRPSPFALWRCY